jgi:hypothetical protein
MTTPSPSPGERQYRRVLCRAACLVPPRDTMSTQRSIRHTDRHVVLSDGRRLTYADLGDPKSMPC